MIGMTCAHAGLGVIALGIAFTTAFSTERELVMNEGDTVAFAEYEFVFRGVQEVKGPNYHAKRGHLSVYHDSEPVVDLHPEKRTYLVQASPMTEAAIHSTVWRDVYAALGVAQPGGGWGVRLYVKPFIQWLWGGALLMAFGGLLALSDRRYRYRRRRRRT